MCTCIYACRAAEVFSLELMLRMVIFGPGKFFSLKSPDLCMCVYIHIHVY